MNDTHSDTLAPANAAAIWGLTRSFTALAMVSAATSSFLGGAEERLGNGRGVTMSE